jgi:uncharacterized caspase-like protein
MTRILFLTCIILLSLESISQERRVALVIGNSNYKHSGKLKNPKNDADLMAATLEGLGFQVLKKTDATKREIDEVLLSFWRELSRNEVALFYYAGHGIQHQGTNYLLPVDAMLEDALALEIEAVDVEKVVKPFSNYPSNVNIVILDACRDNPFRTWTRSTQQGFKAMSTPSGSIIAYATSEGATASDGTGMYGLYTEVLTEQMNIPQRIEDVFINTRITVNMRSGGRQIPQEWTQLNGPFMLAQVIEDISPPDLTILRPNVGDRRSIDSENQTITLIGEVRDDQKVDLLLINNQFIDLDASGYFSAEFSLDEGANQFSILAADHQRNKTVKDFVVNYTPVPVTLANRILLNSKYYALIIGADLYDDPDLPDLKNSISHAKQLQEVLADKYTFEKENITFLRNPTREDIIETLDRLSSLITPDDLLLIYYSGHSHWDDQSNVGYWLPTDATMNSRANWFRNSTMVDYLKEIQSKHTLLVTDATFAGSIYKTRGIQDWQDPERAYEILFELRSRKAMTSGVLELNTESSFTKYLINRLNQNEDIYLTSEQLFASFRLAVINNSDAVPQYGEIRNVGDEGGDFIFLLRQ